MKLNNSFENCRDILSDTPFINEDEITIFYLFFIIPFDNLKYKTFWNAYKL